MHECGMLRAGQSPAELLLFQVQRNVLFTCQQVKTVQVSHATEAAASRGRLRGIPLPSSVSSSFGAARVWSGAAGSLGKVPTIAPNGATPRCRNPPPFRLEVSRRNGRFQWSSRIVFGEAFHCSGGGSSASSAVVNACVRCSAGCGLLPGRPAAV